jgi:hypothetical protein
MVRRRSTVRFRKGAPAQRGFSPVKPKTCFLRGAFEGQNRRPRHLLPRREEVRLRGSVKNVLAGRLSADLMRGAAQAMLWRYATWAERLRRQCACWRWREQDLPAAARVSRGAPLLADGAAWAPSPMRSGLPGTARVNALRLETRSRCSGRAAGPACSPVIITTRSVYVDNPVISAERHCIAF